MTSRTSSGLGHSEVRSLRTRAGAGLAVCTTVALSTLLGPAGVTAAATVALPDLVADPPGASLPPQVYTDSSGTSSLLLRFDGFVHNQGAGAVELRGSAPVDTEMTVVQQRLYDGDGGYSDTTHDSPAVIRYEPADGHNHWHLRHAAAYSLWNEARTTQVGAANKVGFCLVDSAHVDPFGPATKTYTTSNTGFCHQNNPGAQSVHMGVSPGWRDVYSRFLAYQWVDISNVSPGRYWLRSTVDPDDVVIESNETNPAAFAANQSIVNGYVATSFSKRVGTLLPSSIPLQATTFDDPHPGSPGTRQFKIVSGPKNGTLNQPLNTWFSASSVMYRPRFGYSGQDSFTFAARDSASAFPRVPVQASASIGVGVNPAAAPAAQQPSTTTVATRTAPAPDVQATPSVADGAALGQPVVSREGPWVLVSVAAGRAGLVRMTATSASGAQLGNCLARVPAGALLTCRFDDPEAGARSGQGHSVLPTVRGVRMTALHTAAVEGGTVGLTLLRH